MKKLLFMGILSILFVGCSTSPVNSNQTAMVPESRMVDSDYFTRKSEDQLNEFSAKYYLGCMGMYD